MTGAPTPGDEDRAEDIPESMRQDTPAAPEPEPDPEQPGEAGTLAEDAAALLHAARDGIAATTIGLRAFKTLFIAEAALARDALVLSVVFLLASMIGFGTAYVLLTALVVYGLHWLGVPSALALSLPLLASALFGWLAMRWARAAFRYTDFEATRRQFERGLAPVPDNPEAPSPERASSPAEKDA